MHGALTALCGVCQLLCSSVQQLQRNLRRRFEWFGSCWRLQPLLEEQQAHSCAAPASAGFPRDLPRQPTCKSSSDGAPGWRVQHVQGASEAADASTLQPPPWTGTLARACSTQEPHASGAGAAHQPWNPVTRPATFTRQAHDNTYLSYSRNAIISTVAGGALVQHHKAEGKPPLAGAGLLLMGGMFMYVGSGLYVYQV